MIPEDALDQTWRWADRWVPEHSQDQVRLVENPAAFEIDGPPAIEQPTATRSCQATQVATSCA